MPKIGYFIPEFPGQTHIFFWREYQGLKAQGIEPLFISTRRPAQRIISHAWAQEAMAATRYLMPLRPGPLLGALGEIARANPVGWARVLASIARAEGVDKKQRARLFGLAAVGAELAHLARAEGLSHVHVHSCADAAHVCMFAHLLSGLTYSMTLHGPLRDYGPNQKEKWRHASFVIVITQRLLKEAQEELAGYLPPRVEIAPMGVELHKFQRQSAYHPWEGTGPLRIFSCGRLNVCKGHDDLARAVKLLRDRGIDARVTIAGEDEAGGTTYRKVLEAEIASLGIADHVTLLGAVSEARVLEELERAHVFSLASIEEPLGVAIMEAMAMRLPVVVTGAGGVPELVDDGRDGLLVTPAKPAELAERILELAQAPERARALSEAGRLKIERSFDSLRSVRLMRELLPPSP